MIVSDTFSVFDIYNTETTKSNKMAKKSVIARERKRERLVAKYADLRKQLKAEGKWDELDKLPRNSNKIRLHNRCKLSGRPKGFIRSY